MKSTLQAVREAGQQGLVDASVRKTVLSGSLAESFLSGIALVLTLIGLSGIYAGYMLPIAAIAIGSAFLIEGMAISSRFSKLLAETSKDRLEKTEFSAGLTSEYLGGATGVVLGILSLVGVYPMVLLSVALLVFGVTLMLSSGLTARLNSLETETSEESERFKRIAHEAMVASVGGELMLGLGGIALGVIALSGLLPVTLTLVGMLIVSVSAFVTGAAGTTRMLSLSRR
ncbi:MAG: hypothetical protein P8013_04395 [Candidatus Sulfobium sp.]|jgi:hypothetical protein